MRIAFTSAELMRGLWRIDCGMAARHVGQVVLFCCTHLVKQPRQKLCWQGACKRAPRFQALREAAKPRGARTVTGRSHRLKQKAHLSASSIMASVLSGAAAPLPACSRKRLVPPPPVVAWPSAPRARGCNLGTHPWCRLLQEPSRPRVLLPWAQSQRTSLAGAAPPFQRRLALYRARSQRCGAAAPAWPQKARHRPL